MNLNFNDNQKDAIFYDNDNPLLIEAGPGSGKTAVLTERVKFLLTQKNVDPESLLVITFSRKATEELKKRLSKDISSDTINKMQISTIHGFCFELLNKYGNFSYEILDDDNGEKKILFLQKHKYELGFKNESYISNNGIKSVIDKYGEYSTFKVIPDKLIQYIESNREIREDFKEFVKSYKNGFPYKEIRTSEKEYKNDWYNAKYLQTAKSYSKYLKLLDKNYLVDYDTLQIKALEFLEKNQITQYKNVLIDEFQDTNPVQYLIFEILLKNADSFTVVGDVDQSIYGFRGALSDYFDLMINNYDCHLISLNKNYRSTENIVNLTEQFIQDYRSEKSKKHMEHVKEYNNHCCYIKNETLEEQADNIGEYIENLKKTDKIKNYSDVAILMRSVKFNNLTEISHSLTERNIPYNVKNFSNMLNDDIKSLITILHYILPRSDNDYFFGKFERDWLNLRAFTRKDDGNSFTPTLWKLSDETCKLLNDIQDKFEKEAIETTKNVHKKYKGRRPGKLSFTGIFNDSRTDEMLKEIFTITPRPKIDLDLIKNNDDKEFFTKLNDLKDIVEYNVGKIILNSLELMDVKTKDKVNVKFLLEKISFIKDLISKNDILVECGLKNDVVDFENKLKNDNISYEEVSSEISHIRKKVEDNYNDKTILEIFYKILEITNFFENNPGEEALNNLGVISESMYNFENIIGETDLKGYFNFLQNNIEEWEGKELGFDDGVQIMTIHKSKGLEFPVVIIPSLEQDHFPKKYQDSRKRDWINRKSVFYTPNSCLEYKKHITDEEDKKLFDLEELRIIYVALTRAQDSLLLSFLGEIPKDFINLIDNGKIKPLILTEIDKCESVFVLDEDKSLNTSFTSLQSYDECPYRYKLLYDLNFKVSDKNDIRMGSAIHNAFNKINIALMDNPHIANKEIDKIISDIFYSTTNISKTDEDFDKFKESIHAFYEKIGDIKILETEYKFNLLEKEYSMVGSIDLIYEKEGKITIVDYKNTEFNNNFNQKYKNQLCAYIYALKQDADYANKQIDFSGIYAVQSQELIYIDVSDDEVNGFSNKMDSIVSKIKNEEFNKNEDCKFDTCEFRFICNNLDES